VIRCISRRLERLETLTAANRREPIAFRVLLVDPERGLTGVLVIEGDKPTMRVAGTPEEVEKIGVDLERRRGSPDAGGVRTGVKKPTDITTYHSAAKLPTSWERGRAAPSLRVADDPLRACEATSASSAFYGHVTDRRCEPDLSVLMPGQPLSAFFPLR
jgi:hypothetical protein